MSGHLKNIAFLIGGADFHKTPGQFNAQYKIVTTLGRTAQLGSPNCDSGNLVIHFDGFPSYT